MVSDILENEKTANAMYMLKTGLVEKEKIEIGNILFAGRTNFMVLESEVTLAELESRERVKKFSNFFNVSYGRPVYNL